MLNYCLKILYPDVTYSLIFTLDISYTLTLDADLQASRVTSRGLFTKNNERFLTEKAKISSTPLCKDYQVYVQVMDENDLFCSHQRVSFIIMSKIIISWFSLYGFFHRRLQTLSIPSV